LLVLSHKTLILKGIQRFFVPVSQCSK
jgi:hypothetical protein